MKESELQIWNNDDINIISNIIYFKGSRFERFPILKILAFKDSSFWRFPLLKIPRFKDSPF